MEIAESVSEKNDVLPKRETLFHVLLGSSEKFSDDIAYIYQAAGSEIRVKYSKVFEDILLLARALAAKGVSADDRVMFLSDNCYAWIVTDLAIMSLGAVTVPRGSDTPSLELNYIIENSSCSHLVVETRELLERHQDIIKRATSLKTVFVMEGPAIHSVLGKTHSYQELLEVYGGVSSP